MRYEFHPEALEEYRQAAGWYSERESELGQQFIGSVEDTIKRVVEAPTRWRVIEEDVRRCLTRVFPYAVLYTIEPDFLLIVAVMHCSREPGYWRGRK
ncbi:MAG TPA: type II toxin-antitoxin system RelE/ParE family toxin [Pyrinomonadaceae bacterium]|jgi:plasmid stabilization system protein ParE|nr:type II toxin-antitoxin system RelE/ParE family toxin [Pyrinomonadaceae bacterium]